MKSFDKLLTSEQYLAECERANRGEIHIEQLIVVRSGAHNWRITGIELSAEERSRLRRDPSPIARASSLNDPGIPRLGVGPTSSKVKGANIGAAEARGPVGSKRGKSAFSQKQSAFKL
jgi:hypothetical protein